ncbi:hypothetical protein GEMRC1_000815 [Eukaryota sp. GEM-RC1]
MDITMFLRTLHLNSTKGNVFPAGLLESSDYWWPEAKEDLIEHLNSCPSCQKNAPVPKSRNDIPSTGNLIANRPFESLHVDTIGPLPKDIQGNAYVVVFVDSFSRFTVLVPLNKLNATEVAYAMLEKVCAIFGIPSPSTPITDRNTQTIFLRNYVIS